MILQVSTLNKHFLSYLGVLNVTVEPNMSQARIYSFCAKGHANTGGVAIMAINLEQNMGLPFSVSFTGPMYNETRSYTRYVNNAMAVAAGIYERYILKDMSMLRNFSLICKPLPLIIFILLTLTESNITLQHQMYYLAIST